MDKLSDRKIFRRIVERKRKSSSSEDGYEKDWGWKNGGWWSRATFVRGVRVHARKRRKNSRRVGQMLGQEEKKMGDEKWSNWRKSGGTEISTTEKEFASSSCDTWSRGGVLSTSAGQEPREENSDCSNALPGAGRGTQGVRSHPSGVFM